MPFRSAVRSFLCVHRRSLSLSPCRFHFICCSSRGVSFVVSSVVSSCVSFSCVSACLVVMRLVVSFVRLVCLSSSFVSYGAPFRPAARSFSFRPSWRSCIAFSCRPVFALAFRLVVLFPRLVSPSRCGVSSVRPARRLVCLVSWGGSFLFSCLFLCLRRFILLVARSCPLSVHVPTIAVVSDAAVRHGVAGLLFASHPSHHLLLVRSSGGAPFRVARRSFIALFMPYRPHPSHRFSSLSLRARISSTRGGIGK